MKRTIRKRLQAHAWRASSQRRKSVGDCNQGNSAEAAKQALGKAFNARPWLTHGFDGRLSPGSDEAGNGGKLGAYDGQHRKRTVGQNAQVEVFA